MKFRPECWREVPVRPIVWALLSLGASSAALALPPVTPSNRSPADGGWTTASAPLSGSTYSDPEGDLRVAAYFEVRLATGTYGGAGSVDSGTLGSNSYWTTPALTDGLQYFWHLQYSDGAWSSFSAETNFTVDAVAPSQPPTPVSVPDPCTGTCNLSWTPSTDNLSGVSRYSLERNDNDGGSYGIGITVGLGASYSVILGPGKYLYRVYAQDVAGNRSGYSTPSLALNLVAPGGIPVPSAASGPTLTSASVQLAWPDAGVDSYVLSRSGDDGGTWSHRTVVTGLSTTDNAPATGFYRYRLSGVVGGLVSDWSASSNLIQVDDTRPTTPGPIDAGSEPYTDTGFTLSWGASTDLGGSGLVGYGLERSPDAPVTWTVLANPSTNVYPEIVACGRWQYRVRSADGVGNTSFYTTTGILDVCPASDAGVADAGGLDAGADAGALDGGCAAPVLVVHDANLFAAVGVSYQLNATGQVGVTGGTGPVGFASCATPAVAGFQVDPATGLVFWTPAAAGTVSLCLRAQDSCSSDSYSFDVGVAAAAVSPPMARITAAPPAAGVSDSISLDGSTSTAGPGATLVSYQWDFGDGDLGNGVGLSHSFALSGGYTVHLTVTDTFGSQGSTSVGVVVGDAECPNPPLVQVLADSLHGVDSLTVSFGCNCTQGIFRAWDFGDDTGSSVAEPSHTYGPGRYRARLWGVDGNGCVGSDDVEVVVDKPPYFPPICRASASPSAGRVPLPVTFTAAYVDPNLGGLITQAAWTFEDDGSTRLEPVVQRTFDTPATVRATLRVKNNHGLVCTDRVDVVVQTASGETPPQVFTVPSKEAACRAAYHYAKELEDRPLARGTRPIHWYSGVGTPRALAVDSTTGQVQWTPSEAKLERVSLIASNPAGTAGQSYEVDVTCSASESKAFAVDCGCQGAEGGLDGLALVALAALGRRCPRRCRK